MQRDKPMLGGIKTEQDIWAECTKTILGLLESYFLADQAGGNTLATKRLSYSCDLQYKPTTSQKAFLPLSSTTDPGTPTIKRKRSVYDSARERKMQRISLDLANEVARSLSMTDQTGLGLRHHEPELPVPTSAGYGSDDVDMTGTVFQQQQQPLSSPRLYRKARRRLNTPRRNTDYAAPQKNSRFTEDISPIPTLRRISFSGAKPCYSVTDSSQWLRIQAQRHNVSMLDFKHFIYEKKKLLQHSLAQLKNVDSNKSDYERFQEIKENLYRVLRTADELKSDYAIAIADICPDWGPNEGLLQKLAAYVQSVEDMRQITSLAIPRSSDLVHDIRQLQELLESKMALYGDNLVQNGLEWKASGLPIDEHLFSSVKGWFYSVCIGLLGELDMECSMVQSLVTKMSDLIHLRQGEKLMESILTGLEFIAAVISFIGTPSKKVLCSCQILATIYGQWVCENLEDLNNIQLQKNSLPKDGDGYTAMDVKLSHTANRSSRLDIRFLFFLENMARILSSLYILQTGTTDDLHSARGQSAPFIHSTESVPLGDADPLCVVENFAIVLVDITVRALAIIETSRDMKQGAGPSSKRTNIMANPQMAMVHMSESILTYTDKIMELSGRFSQEAPRVQRLHAHLEEIEASI